MEIGKWRGGSVAIWNEVGSGGVIFEVVAPVCDGELAAGKRAALAWLR